MTPSWRGDDFSRKVGEDCARSWAAAAVRHALSGAASSEEAAAMGLAVSSGREGWPEDVLAALDGMTAGGDLGAAFHAEMLRIALGDREGAGNRSP